MIRLKRIGSSLENWYERNDCKVEKALQFFCCVSFEGGRKENDVFSRRESQVRRGYVLTLRACDIII
jgi:hypothetical protein